jgi:hypothetical protein
MDTKETERILILIHCILLRVNELRMNTPEVNATIYFINY